MTLVHFILKFNVSLGKFDDRLVSSCWLSKAIDIMRSRHQTSVSGYSDVLFIDTVADGNWSADISTESFVV